MLRKPMRAKNYEESKLRFPLGGQPKIDGVRGVNPVGLIKARSMKPFANRYTNGFFSKPEYVGIDGELAAEIETHPRLCSLTTSAVTTILGSPFLLWHTFDLVRLDTFALPYIDRHAILMRYINEQQDKGLCGHLRVVPMKIIENLEELNYFDEENLEQGYEGTICRGLGNPHKEGYSTVREGGLLRIKRFIEEDAFVLSINEGRTNNNVAQINELGKTFRTSHQENQIPNGMVGSMECSIVKDSEFFKAGQIITVSSGCMTEEEAIYYFNNPNELISHFIKFRHFPKGVKDKPRFPTWWSMRAEEDL